MTTPLDVREETEELIRSLMSFPPPQRGNPESEAIYSGWLREKIDSFITLAEERGRNEALKLLEIARCPDIDCDNKGTVACRISDDEWESQQCQFCDERKKLLETARSSEGRKEV